MCKFCEECCSCHIIAPCSYCIEHVTCDICGEKVCISNATVFTDALDGSSIYVCPDCEAEQNEDL